MRRAYLCGKMTGEPEMNFPAFNKAAAWLRSENWSCFNPAENSGDQTGTRAEYLTADIKAIIGGEHNGHFYSPVDAVVVLPGWEHSRGARLEVEVALQCGIDVLWAYTLNPLSRLDFELARSMDHDEYLLPSYQGVPA